MFNIMITKIIIKIQTIKNHLVISLTMIFVNRAKNKIPKNETNRIKNVLKSIIVLNELIYEINVLNAETIPLDKSKLSKNGKDKTPLTIQYTINLHHLRQIRNQRF